MKLSEKPVPIGIAAIIALQVLLLAGKGKDQPKDVATSVTDAKTVKKKTKTVVTKRPDGTTRTETSVTESTGTKRKTEQKETEVVRKNHVQALIGTSVKDFGVPVYGLSYQREVFSQVSVGAFGLTNGTVGVSLGVSF